MRILLLTLLFALSGCADLSYYLHSVNGHLGVIAKSRDIDDVLHDENTSADLRERLLLVAEIRRFAVEKLHLPDSDSYTEYADLQREYVLKSLFASEEFSTAAHQWCYPIVGCAGYRGYFDEARLQTYIDELKASHFDIYVANVPAYSTLGWFDDPVLNTFINWPEYRLAGLIFHELTHQRLYIDGDTTFNESFAVAVQQAGVQKWLQHHGELDKLAAYQRHIVNRGKVLEFIENERDKLALLYRQDLPDDSKRATKARMLDAMRQQYVELSAEFGGSDGFAKWFEGELNNAKLVSVSTYHALAPAFVRLLEHHGGDFNAFFEHVEEIARLEPQQRQQCLEHWHKGPPESPRPLLLDVCAAS